MSSLMDKKKQVQESGVNKYGFIIALLFMIWLFLPTQNSFVQMSYWAYNIVHKISASLGKQTIPDYIYFRNKAVYKAKIYKKNPTPSMKEFDNAFAALKDKEGGIEAETLLKERALVKTYYGDKEGAIEDYEKADDLSTSEYLRLAVFLADTEKYEEAGEYCETIIKTKGQAITGYVCYAHIYEKKGENESAQKIYDWLVNQKPDNILVYLERANFKKRMNDTKGYEDDMKRAKEINTNVFIGKSSLIDSEVYMKNLPLLIK